MHVYSFFKRPLLTHYTAYHCIYATQYQNFDFNLRRDHQKKIPMSVATMSR